MQKNLIVAMPQVTVDRTFQVGERVSDVAKYFVEKELFTDYRDVLASIQREGLRSDHLLHLREDDPKSLEDIREALDYLRLEKNRFREAPTQVGGNPAIMAFRCAKLTASQLNSDHPDVKYSGLFPKSLADFLTEMKGHEDSAMLRRVFDLQLCKSVDAEPQTIALEANFKVIIAYGPGRKVTDIAPDADFSLFVQNLWRQISEDYRRILFAFSIPHPIDKGIELVSALKRGFGERAKIFVGCSSLRVGRNDEERIRTIWNGILKDADMISLNETELRDLHTEIVGNGVFQRGALASKLRELPTLAIKVCHAAEGAILDPGPKPERVVNSALFSRDPHGFLEECLTLAADGATFAIDSLYGHSATEAGVRAYSKTSNVRSGDLFKAVFLEVLGQMPGGLVTVQSPMVARPLSALTGVGARFDALLASFLMRD